MLAPLMQGPVCSSRSTTTAIADVHALLLLPLALRAMCYKPPQLTPDDLHWDGQAEDAGEYAADRSTYLTTGDTFQV